MPWFSTPLGMLGSRCNIKGCYGFQLKWGEVGGESRDNCVWPKWKVGRGRELNRVGREGKGKIAGEEVRVRETMVMCQIIIM